MKFFYGVVTTLILLCLGAVLFIYSGIYNVSAADGHTQAVDWVLHTAMHRSVAQRAGGIDVPADLDDQERIRQGAQAYDQLCVACHLKPGQSDTLVRQGLTPTPPDLTLKGHWDAREQFWIIDNGIKMTGMPAWGESHGEEDLWDLTAFLQRLPSLSESQYTALVAERAGGNNAMGDGHDHVHADMSGMAGDESNGAATQVEHGDHGNGHHGQDNEGTAVDSEHSGAGESESPEAAPADDHFADGHTH